MAIVAKSIPMFSDNYAWLLQDRTTGVVAVIDPADARATEAAVLGEGGRLDLILLTHHHDDHIAGVDEVRARFGAKVVGAKADAHRLPTLDQALVEGDSVAIGDSRAHVIDTPGHTVGHIAFHIPEGGVLACGDTLFSLGCGRLIEGTADQMYASLKKLAALPGDTLICCGHEYTASNARFALHVDPDNAALRARASEVEHLRAAGHETVPTRLSSELDTNPFLRAPDVATFARLRSQKDSFR